MTTKQLVDELVSHEFRTPCAIVTCTNDAEWGVWVAHAHTSHGQESSLRCDRHKEALEGNFADSVRMRHVCRCGYQIAGDLADHFRAIRL